MNLLIIGQGAWAAKIRSVFRNRSYGIQVNSLSARLALKDSRNLGEAAKNSDVVWICTKPNWQLELVPKLKQFCGKLILEKPYIVDSNSLHKLNDFLKDFNGILQLSEPWTFSNVWTAIRNEIKESSDTEYIIERGGPTGHNFLSTVMDWIPHDINLLFDLYGTELMKSEIRNIHSKGNGDKLEFQVRVGAGNLFRCKIGDSQGDRVAFWKSRDLRINFLSSTLVRGWKEEIIIQNVNPFILQVNSTIQNSVSRTREQLEVQNYFFETLFK